MSATVRRLEQCAAAHGGIELVRRTNTILERTSANEKKELYHDFHYNLRKWNQKRSRGEDVGVPAVLKGQGAPPQCNFLLRCWVCWKRVDSACKLCKVCNPYKECLQCYEEKKKDGHPHPHFKETPDIAGADSCDAVSVSSLPVGAVPSAAGRGQGVLCATTMYDSLFPEPKEGYRNILSFDGGGIRGYLSMLLFEKYIKLLMLREGRGDDVTPEEVDIFAQRVVREKFSLVTGTSIGGIIAIMLGMETPLSYILKLFETRAHEIFHKNSMFKVTSSNYSGKGIRQVCIDVIQSYLDRNPALKDRGVTPETLRLIDLPLRVAVTTMDLETNSVMYLPVHARNVTCLDSALSTSAAPTYFPIHEFELDGVKLSCIDGGMWANDPRLAAIMFEELKKKLEHEAGKEAIEAEEGEKKKGKEEEERKPDNKHLEIAANEFEDDEGVLQYGGDEPLPMEERNVFHVMSIGTGIAAHYRTHGFVQAQNSIGWMMGNPSIIDLLLDASEDMVTKMIPYLALTSALSSAKLQVTLPHDIALDDVNSLKEQKQLVDALPDSTYDDAVDLSVVMGCPSPWNK